MMKPYNRTEPKKTQVRTMFDRIAPRYDLLNHLLSLGIDRRWRSRVIGELRPSDPHHILDVATGTGDLAIALGRMSPQVCVTGVDLSEEMVAVGRRKVDERGLAGRVSLSTGDAEALAFDDGTFDAATVAFGVRNFSDIPKGLSEMTRTLRKSGTLAVLEFSRPDSKIFGTLFRFYFHRVLPVVGGWISKDRAAYSYLPSSVDEFPAPERFLGMMSDAGLDSCRAVPLTFGVAYIYIGIKR